MRKIIILILPILLLTGCRANLDGSTDVDDDKYLKVYCDEEYGIEYLRDTQYKNGGITVRLDSNGNVIRCNGE